MSAPIKICTRRSFRNRRGACSEIEEAFAFSKAGLLRDHEGRSQKSKRRLLSQKLGCSKTTKADLRNRRGLLSQKLGCSETTRADLRNRRGTYFSNLVSTCHTHTQLCGNYGHAVKDFWRSRKPHITLPKFSDKVETRKACSSHYIALTKKGKRIAKKQH
ncbi:hypothetical protein ACFX2H_033001 [Malus domestica]